MSSLPQDAREFAIFALNDRAGNVSAHLERILARADLSQADRGLAREIAMGSVRRRATIEAVLRRYLVQPERKLPGLLNQILQAAVYQILFLDRVPQYAAVDQAVRQTATHHHNRQTGLVNGVLRSITRGLSPLQAGPPPLQSDVVPVSPNSYRTFDRAVFPDPAANAVDYLAAAFSLPVDLARRWIERFGSVQEAAKIAICCNVSPPMILRVNRLKTDVPGAIAALAAEGTVAVAHSNGISVVLTDHRNIAELKTFRDGLLQPQDPTASAVALSCGVRPGMKVLDFCAAPGTKTTHLAELMGNKGSILAVDVDEERTTRIASGCQRLGISIVTTCLAKEVPAHCPFESCDVVLADVPCSNSGVLARRAEARWRFVESHQADIARDQRRLAVAAASFVKPGGRLVYSTCSIEPEECQQVGRFLTRRDQRLRMTEERFTLPGGADDATRWCDGGYCAVFEVK